MTEDADARLFKAIVTDPSHVFSLQKGTVNTAYISAGEPMARVPKVARETILSGTRRTFKITEISVKIFYFHTLFTRNRTIRHFEISAYIFLVK